MTTNSFSRLENETDEELIYRICGLKDQIGTWDDVADILNEITGNEYTESKYRKQYQAFLKMLDANRNKFVDSSSQLEDIEEKTRELRKERIKLQTANIERNRIERNEARQEMYYEYIGQVTQSLPWPDFQPLFRNDENEISYVLTLADIHYGATFKSANNEYSPAIAKKRFEYLAGKVIEFINVHEVNRLHILGLGDDIQGILRVNDLKINDSSVVKAVVEVVRLISNFLNEISAYANIDYYHVPSANHSQIRPLGSKASELADEDLEYIIGNYISDMCINNDRITVHLANDGDQYLDLNINGNNIVSGHGHTVKGVNNVLRDLSLMRNKRYDYCILGHFHGGNMFTSYENPDNDCEVIVAPSFIGSDPYSDSLCRGSKASCLILGFEEKHGHTETYKIVLN